MSEEALLTYKQLTPEEEQKLEAYYREKGHRDYISAIAEAKEIGYIMGFISEFTKVYSKMYPEEFAGKQAEIVDIAVEKLIAKGKSKGLIKMALEDLDIDRIKED